MSADRYVDRKEIAFLLDVDVRTITNYVDNHADFPSRVNGKRRTFPAQRCIAWARERAVAAALAKATPPPPANEEGSGLAAAELRKAIADAELSELKAAKLRGDVVAVQAAAKEIRDAFTRVRSRLLSTPGEYAPQILHLEELPKAVLMLRNLIDTVLAELQAHAGGEDDDEVDVEGEDTEHDDVAA